jgi:hypothetical protein
MLRLWCLIPVISVCKNKCLFETNMHISYQWHVFACHSWYALSDGWLLSSALLWVLWRGHSQAHGSLLSLGYCICYIPSKAPVFREKRLISSLFCIPFHDAGFNWFLFLYQQTITRAIQTRLIHRLWPWQIRFCYYTYLLNNMLKTAVLISRLLPCRWLQHQCPHVFTHIRMHVYVLWQAPQRHLVTLLSVVDLHVQHAHRYAHKTYSHK